MSSDNESLILNYHPSCYKKYTAVKRPKEALPTDDEPATKKAYIETRCSGVLPKSDQQGLLKGSCIFCGKSRKKRNGKEEPRRRQRYQQLPVASHFARGQLIPKTNVLRVLFAVVWT